MFTGPGIPLFVVEALGGPWEHGEKAKPSLVGGPWGGALVPTQLKSLIGNSLRLGLPY